MILIADLRSIAEARLNDAKVLMANERTDPVDVAQMIIATETLLEVL